MLTFDMVNLHVLNFGHFASSAESGFSAAAKATAQEKPVIAVGM
jgi:hypothetical protein